MPKKKLTRKNVEDLERKRLAEKIVVGGASLIVGLAILGSIFGYNEGQYAKNVNVANAFRAVDQHMEGLTARVEKLEEKLGAKN